MPIKSLLDRAHRAAPVSLGVITLGAVFVLLLWDVRPRLFPVGAHGLLGALPLALIAVAYLIYQLVRRSDAAEVFKAVLLATAFLLWSANQFWPQAARATLYNDLAIALFVLDVFFVMLGWPAAGARTSLTESDSETL